MADPRPAVEQAGDALASFAAWECERAMDEGPELFRGTEELCEDAAYALARIADHLDESGFHHEIGEHYRVMSRNVALAGWQASDLPGMYKNLHAADLERAERDPHGFWNVGNV